MEVQILRRDPNEFGQVLKCDNCMISQLEELLFQRLKEGAEKKIRHCLWAGLGKFLPINRSFKPRHKGSPDFFHFTNYPGGWQKWLS